MRGMRGGSCGPRVTMGRARRSPTKMIADPRLREDDEDRGEDEEKGVMMPGGGSMAAMT